MHDICITCRVHILRIILPSEQNILSKVLGHGHVFEVWILISSGSDIIIQIRTRGFGVFDWPTVGRAAHRAGRLYTGYDLQELGYARHRSSCPVSFARLCAHKPSC